MQMKTIPRVLTIAGSDSSGGAGIEADLKTFTAHKCYGMTCITGLTAQNTLGVDDIYPVTDQSFVRKCLDAVDVDVGVDAIKTGMLTCSQTVQVVAKKLAEMKEAVEKEAEESGGSSKKLHIVVDPVMVSTSGANLIPEAAIDDYFEELIPLATVFTPNIVETKFILKRIKEQFANEMGMSTANIKEFQIESVEDMKEAAETLHEYFECDAVLVKGGHLVFNKDLTPYKKSDSENKVPNEEELVVVDVLYDGTEFRELKSDYYMSKSTHGTGCTLASAIAANLAKGNSIPVSVKNSIDYVQQAIKSAYSLGKGFGPVNHMHTMQHMPFVSGRFLDYLLDHPKIEQLWKEYVNHPFTQKLGDGSLELAKFKYFLEQDYLYLKHYARCYGLSVYKADDIKTMTKAATVIQHIAHETELHVSYCKEFGLDLEQLEKVEEAIPTYAYSRFLLDVGSTNDWFSLQVALSPCLFGYNVAANNVIKDSKHVKDGNKYWRWVDTYVSDDFLAAVQDGRDLLETHATTQSEDQIERLVDIFATATRMEIEFWNAALRFEPSE